MRPVLALALAAISVPALAAPPAAPQRRSPPAAAPACPGIPITYAETSPRASRVQKLGELPPANHYLAVERQVGGCREPAVVRTGIRG
ncbi:MAG: hypothetical protein JOZ90_16575 [Alphaproteobacteria bacterium]|nr:hypothetical protein [Alphaproteobacteria bacterium]MBV9371573.1 hypothetical protein [Alphaproteobacteria bacterium]MBV9902685.1 hypothetical protein [Alphaproteobacteria bacterium]